ncbi:MAG TPA: GntR family transcriptional regulator [Streptosporangiaceae bacterium]|jgi:DNA-binding GntR family transcriptional regulator
MPTTGRPSPEGPPPLHQRIYETLRTEVISGQRKPGELLSEAELARRWGVSRSPIREALRQLEQHDLVRWAPRRGATVARLTVAGLRDIYEVREALESLSAGLAAERGSPADLAKMRDLAARIKQTQEEGDYLEAIMLDDEFHRLMARTTRNRMLESQAGHVLDRVIMARMMVREEPGRTQEIVHEHQAILDALGRHDAKEATEHAALHVRNARARLMAMLQRASVDPGD